MCIAISYLNGKIEKVSGITNFEEKFYGISFNINECYMFIPYHAIIGFSLINKGEEV